MKIAFVGEAVSGFGGMEYKRTKFNKWVRKFVFWEERMARQKILWLNTI